MMLRIEGTDGGKEKSRGYNDKSGTSGGLELGGDGQGGLGGEEFQKLMMEFDKRMAVLRTVVDSGTLDHGRMHEGTPEMEVDEAFDNEE